MCLGVGLTFYVCLSFLHPVIILKYFRNSQSSLRSISFNYTLDKYKNESERGRMEGEGGWRER